MLLTRKIQFFVTIHIGKCSSFLLSGFGRIVDPPRGLCCLQLCHFIELFVGWSVDWLVCQQDYTKSTEQISLKVGWSMRYDPGTLSVTLWDRTYFEFYVTGICEWVQFDSDQNENPDLVHINFV